MSAVVGIKVITPYQKNVMRSVRCIVYSCDFLSPNCWSLCFVCSPTHFCVEYKIQMKCTSVCIHLSSIIVFSFSQWFCVPLYILTLLILCLWFHASLIYINNCPTRCNTKHCIYYSVSSLYMFRVSTTPTIRSAQNCNCNLWYLSPMQQRLAMLEGGSGTKNITSTRGCSYSFVYSWWWVWLTPEKCTVNLQNNK